MRDPKPLTEGNTLSIDEALAVELLRFRNFSKVGRALGVSRSQVAKWAQGKELTPYRVLQLGELLGRNDESAPPEWAERILAGVMALEQRGQISADELDEAAALAAAWLAAAEQRKPRGRGGGGAGGASSA